MTHCQGCGLSLHHQASHCPRCGLPVRERGILLVASWIVLAVMLGAATLAAMATDLL